MKANFAYRWALGPTGRVIAVSEAVRQSILQSRLFAPERVVTIRNGIDLEPYFIAARDANGRLAFRREQSLTGNPVIGVVGQIAPHKGQDDLLRAAALPVAALTRLGVAAK